MKRYLVLGNGFDLAHELPTKYMDFLFVCNRFLNENIYETKLNYNYKTINSVNMENVYKKFYNKFINDSENKSKLENNRIIYYFIKTYNIKAKKWIDFENEIYNICKCLITFFNLKEEEKEQFCIENEEIITVFCYFDENSTLKKLKSEFNDLCYFLTEYLNIVQDLEINCYYEEIYDFIPDGIINFNYTDTFNKYNIDNIKIDYVHGQINENNIVLGIKGIDDINDPKYAEFIKYFQMVNKNVNLNLINKIEQMKDLESMIFGHSLDNNDNYFLNKIIDNSKNVYISYYSEENKAELIKKLITLLGKDKFIDYFLTINKKIYFIKQNHILKNENIISIFDTIDNIKNIKDLNSIIERSKIYKINIPLYHIEKILTYLNQNKTLENKVIIKNILINLQKIINNKNEYFVKEKIKQLNAYINNFWNLYM